MNLALALQGSLVAQAEAEARAVREGAIVAVRETATELQRDFRLEVRSSLRGSRGRDGSRAANTIRLREFKERDGTVTGFVFSRWRRGGVDVLATQETGATIRPRRAKRLLILFNAADRRRNFRVSVALDKNVRFVPLPGGRTLIVRATRTRSTVIGLLLPVARLEPKIDLDRIRRRAPERLAQRLIRATENASQKEAR